MRRLSLLFVGVLGAAGCDDSSSVNVVANADGGSDAVASGDGGGDANVDASLDATVDGPTGDGAPPSVVIPGDPGAHDVLFALDSTNAHPISRYVYGTNQGDFAAEAKGLTMARVGGDHTTAYNWENNFSNEGSAFLYQNDNYFGISTVAGAPMKQAATAASAASASLIVPVPIAGWVSRDKNGPCVSSPSPSQILQRFVPLVAKKGSAFAYPPDTTDNSVYVDEFVAYMESQFSGAQTDPLRRIFYMLGNEPDLWSSTHSEIHPAQVTYAELVQRNSEFAAAIKGAAPNAIVFGSVNYGWQGYLDLQMAPDASGRDWIDFYLDQMKLAEVSAGKRLVDVLDVHWFPEAQGGGVSIVNDGIGAAEVDARLQAPRSLWDKTYTETSWIAQSSTKGPINLLPRLMAKINAHYPGTKLSISEYNYGAGGDISGGLAEADVLGVFGREGLFAASSLLLSQTNTFLFGGFAMYRNYDGVGGTFGDTSIESTSSAFDKTSVYGSVASANTANVVVVVINKQTVPSVAGITIKHTGKLTAGDVYALTSASQNAMPAKQAGITATAQNAFLYTMPPRSVSTLVFHP